MSRLWFTGAALVLVTSSAFAMSNNVISAFHGEIVVSKDELPEGKNDKDTVTKIRAAALKELTGEPAADVTQWHFHYTAFLSKTGSSAMKMEFVTSDGDKHLAADKKLDGIDPKSNVLSGDITIDEDEGLSKGKTYDVELVSGSTVLAKTTLTMK